MWARQAPSVAARAAPGRQASALLTRAASARRATGSPTAADFAPAHDLARQGWRGGQCGCACGGLGARACQHGHGAAGACSSRGAGAAAHQARLHGVPRCGDHGPAASAVAASGMRWGSRGSGPSSPAPPAGFGAVLGGLGPGSRCLSTSAARNAASSSGEKPAGTEAKGEVAEGGSSAAPESGADADADQVSTAHPLSQIRM